MVAFWCGNTSFFVSRLVAVVNLTYMPSTLKSQKRVALMLTASWNFENSSGKSKGKIMEFCFHEMLGTLIYISPDFFPLTIQVTA